MLSVVFITCSPRLYLNKLFKAFYSNFKVSKWSIKKQDNEDQKLEGKSAMQQSKLLKNGKAR